MVKVRRPLSERDVCDESGVRPNPMDLRLESFLKGSTQMSEAMLLLFDRDLKEYDVPDGRTCSTIEARRACRRIPICLAGRRVGWRLGEVGSPLQSPRRIPTWRGWPSLIGAVASADLTGDGLSSPVRRQGAGAAALGVAACRVCLLARDKGGVSACGMLVRQLACRRWSFFSGTMASVFRTGEGLPSPVAGESRLQQRLSVAASRPAMTGLHDLLWQESRRCSLT